MYPRQLSYRQNVQQYMQNAHYLNSCTQDPIFKLHILAQFVSHYLLKYPLSRATGKRFHFKNQTHIKHYSAKMNAPSARDSLLLTKVSKINPPSNANSCEF